MRVAQGQIRFVVAGRPRVLIEMLADKDAVKAKRVMHAMLQMDKIDIPTLKKAYEQK